MVEAFLKVVFYGILEYTKLRNIFQIGPLAPLIPHKPEALIV